MIPLLLPAALLTTANSQWSPLTWVIILLAAIGVALWIRANGRADAPQDEASRRPFVSGNRLDSPEAAHFAGSHLYSGFIEALKGYYTRIIPFHNGRLTDYFLTFALTLGLVLLLLRLFR